MNLDRETVEAARDRGGAAAEDHPEEISEALESETLGHREGEPLVGESYQDYPSREALSNPDRGEFLRDLLGHPLVDGLDSAVEELTGGRDSGHLSDWLATLEAATEAHGLDVDTLLAKSGEGEQGGGDTLTSILGYEPPEDLVTANNPLLVSELYVKGLSIKEIADTLAARVEGDVREGSVRDCLKNVGLLEGRTRDEQQTAFEDKGGRLGGTTVDRSESEDTSPDLTISASDF